MINHVCPSWALDEKSHAGLTKQGRVMRISPRSLQELPGPVEPPNDSDDIVLPLPSPQILLLQQADPWSPVEEPAY